MATRAVRIGGVTIGGGAPLALIGGPCAIESEAHALMMAERLQAITAAAGVPFVYKSSYDKANRSLGALLPRPRPQGRPAHPGAA